MPGVLSIGMWRKVFHTDRQQIELAGLLVMKGKRG
jgi:hypothetical protein